MRNILITGLTTKIGGIESIILDLVNNMGSSRLCFDFLIPKGGDIEYKELLVENSSQVFRVTSWGENPFKYKKEIKAIIQNKKYDIVWINTCNASNITLQKLIKNKTNSKIVIHAHGSSFEANNKLKYNLILMLHKINITKFNKLTDYRFTCSKKASDWLFPIALQKNEQIIQINNAIDANRYKYDENIRKKYRKELGVEEKNVMLHVGRLSKVKNHKFLVQIFDQLLEKKSNSVLLLVGSGSMEMSIKKQALSLGILDKIKFLGTRNDIPGILQAADVFVLPSFHEGLPVVMIEAQAAGLQIFASDTITKEADITDLVTYLPINKSPKLWVKKILKSLDNHQRISRTKEIKNSGFDIKALSAAVEEILISI